MGSFRDFLSSDLKNTFFNPKEFAEKHIINDKEIEIIIDNDKLKDRQYQMKKAEGTYLGDVLFYAKKNDLPGKPVIGLHMKLDTKMYRVTEVNEDEEMYEITLGVNRS